MTDAQQQAAAQITKIEAHIEKLQRWVSHLREDIEDVSVNDWGIVGTLGHFEARLRDIVSPK